MLITELGKEETPNIDPATLSLEVISIFVKRMPLDPNTSPTFAYLLQCFMSLRLLPFRQNQAGQE